MDEEQEKQLEAMLGRASTDIVKESVQRTAFLAQKIAELGIGTTLAAQFGRPPDAPDDAPTTAIIVVSGPFPQDLLDGLFSHVNGLLQDFQAGNPARFVDLKPKTDGKPD